MCLVPENVHWRKEGFVVFERKRNGYLEKNRKSNVWCQTCGQKEQCVVHEMGTTRDNGIIIIIVTMGLVL